jgi:hypothetical protein
MLTQTEVRKMVEEHVHGNVSMLIMHLSESGSHDYVEEVVNVQTKPDYMTPASDEGIKVEKDTLENFWVLVEGEDPDGPYSSENEAWEKACEYNDIEPYNDEAYEYWIVSDWLRWHLERRGEMVEDIFGLNVWGRCATGQAIFLDYVIEDIYNESESLKR